MELNSMYFSEEQVKNGEMTEFLNVLLKQCYGVSKYYNDIHIKPEDCGAFVVEWVNIPWDHSFGGHFAHVGEDEIVMLEKRFPDGHYEYFSDEEEYETAFEKWLKKHPEWQKNEYGCWYEKTKEDN